MTGRIAGCCGCSTSTSRRWPRRPEVFARNTGFLRREYAAVDEPRWRAGRGAVLARFLAAPAIFRTRLAPTYAARARENLTAAIADSTRRHEAEGAGRHEAQRQPLERAADQRADHQRQRVARPVGPTSQRMLPSSAPSMNPTITTRVQEARSATTRSSTSPCAGP